MDIICLLFLSIIIQSGEFSAVVPAHGRIVLEICLRVLRRGNGVLEAVTAQSSATVGVGQILGTSFSLIISVDHQGQDTDAGVGRWMGI